MYGRRDLVDSHLFLRGRLTAAVLRIDPDSPEQPLRRNDVGMKIGIAVALVVALIVAVLNIFLFTVNDVWRNTPSALILDESTGTRYFMVDETLHPVLNLTSAALFLGAPPELIKVSPEDIAGVPRGEGIGKAGLPDSLPSSSSTTAVWTACAADDGAALNVAPRSDAAEMSHDEAVLVSAGDELHLIWNDSRLRIADDWVARALGFEPNDARDVAPAFLNTIPSGADLDLSALTLGGEGPLIAGEESTLGQLIEVSGAQSSDNTYVVTADGLMHVTDTVDALLRAAPDSDLPDPRVISPRALTTATVVETAAWQDQLPTTIPIPLDDHVTPCSIWNDGEIVSGSVSGRSLSEAVVVAPGSGLLAATASAPGVHGAGLYLVSDAGTKYPVANAATATALGLDAASSPAIPEDFLALLPTGPLIAQ
ncbi:type VII secretion protein EccB [Microbacterium sp.]|uniref:type VII secretion protein EccB n=1 Tax=Microbacterium sp. TaxID=51671 RepID=UPI0026236DE5|nr:type VII secretion protein EccB [Microbacterium sp.]